MDLTSIQAIVGMLNGKKISNKQGVIFECLVLDFINKTIGLNIEHKKYDFDCKYDVNYFNQNKFYNFEISTAKIKHGDFNKNKLKQFYRRKEIQDCLHKDFNFENIYISSNSEFNIYDKNFKLMFNGDFEIIKNKHYYEFKEYLLTISKKDIFNSSLDFYILHYLN